MIPVCAKRLNKSFEIWCNMNQWMLPPGNTTPRGFLSANSRLLYKIRAFLRAHTTASTTVSTISPRQGRKPVVNGMSVTQMYVTWLVTNLHPGKTDLIQFPFSFRTHVPSGALKVIRTVKNAYFRHCLETLKSTHVLWTRTHAQHRVFVKLDVNAGFELTHVSIIEAFQQYRSV